MLNKINYRVSDDINFWIDDIQYVKNHLSVYEEINKKDIAQLSKYTFEKYYEISKLISNSLNNIHKTNYDDYFWRKTFNYGLLILITDLHQHFNFLEKNYNPDTHISNILSENSFKISDTFEDQRIFLQSDLGYEQIFSLYIRFKKEKFNKEIRSVKKTKFDLFNSFKRLIRNFQLRFSFKKNVKTIICNSYFEKKYLNKITKEYNKIHAIFHDKIIFINSVDKKKRELIFQLNNDFKDFDQFLIYSLEYLLPKIYLEGFKSASSATNRILNNFPKLQNIVSEGWITNTASSFLLAYSKNKGVNHYCNEHNSISHPFVGDFLKLSIDLSDVFLTFGWESPKIKIIKSSSLYKFKLQENLNKNNQILFVAGPLGRNFPVYSSVYGSCGFFSNYIIDFNEEFFMHMSKFSSNNIIFRNYPEYKSRQIKLLNPIYKTFITKYNLHEADLNTDCLTQMSQSKLIIIDYISTSFLEAIISNFPVIVCLTKGYFLEEDFSDFFIDLKQCGIIQTDPLKLAIFINKIKDNPNEWWNSSKVQNARNKFISQNIDTSQTILDQIKNL